MLVTVPLMVALVKSTLLAALLTMVEGFGGAPVEKVAEELAQSSPALLLAKARK